MRSRVRQSARLVEAFHQAGLPVILVNVVPFGSPSGLVRTETPGLPKDAAGQKQAREAMEAAGFFAIVPELGAKPGDIRVTDMVEGAHQNSLKSIFPRIGEVDSTDVIIEHLKKR